MELATTSLPARTKKEGVGTYYLVAADEVKITVAGEDRLEIAVPAGKVWDVTITVIISETDA